MVNQKRKEFSIFKWVLFPALSLALAGAVAWLNVRIFGWADAVPYVAIVGLIAFFSVAINRYTSARDRLLAVSAFVAEILLTAALIINAAYSLSVQREVSMARQGGIERKEAISEISRLRDRRAQREAVRQMGAAENQAAVFARYEAALFWIMVSELGLFALCAFTLFGVAQLRGDGEKTAVDVPNAIDRPSAEDWPNEIDADGEVSLRGSKRQSSLRRAATVATVATADGGKTATPVAVLRERLREIALDYPGRWFKADSIDGGVTIRMCERQRGREVTIASTRQSSRLLADASRPGFRERLLGELIAQGFPLK